MQSTRYTTIEKNLLIGAGAYYLSGWLGMPLALGFGKLTQGLTYRGDFNSYFMGPLIVHLPRAIVAAAAGAAVAWLVESERPVGWAIFPAILYGLLGFLGHHWARPPLPLDRVAQTIGAVFPALACIVGAVFAGRRSIRPEAQPSSN